MPAKRIRLQQLSLCKIVLGAGEVRMYVVSERGERFEWRLPVHSTECVLFTGKNAMYFANRVKAVCEARLRKVEGGCAEARRHAVFAKSERCIVYATPAERERRYGTVSAMECLVVHRLETSCDCAVCTRVADVFADIAQIARGSGVTAHRHCEIQCAWMNTVVRKLKGCEHVVGMLPACKVSYLATHRGPGGLLQAFILIRPGSTSHVGHALSVTTATVVHEAVDAYPGPRRPGTVHRGSSAQLLQSLVATLELDCDIVVTYADDVAGLARPLLVDLKRLYDDLPPTTTGIVSNVKTGVDMFLEAGASPLDQLVAHDLGTPRVVLDGDLAAPGTIARVACCLRALDMARGLVALCLQKQRCSCIPLSHSGDKSDRRGPGRPTAMRNSLMTACTDNVLMPIHTPSSAHKLRAPCRYRDDTVAVQTGSIALLDFVAFYPSIVVERGISAEVPAGGDAEGIFVALTKRLMRTREDAKCQISLLARDDALTAEARSRRIAKYQTIQQDAKNRMNAIVGVLACTNAGCMYDPAQAARVYECAKQCLQSVLDVLQSEFATCGACGCTHRFGSDGCADGCEAAVRAEPLRPLETVTDSVVFALSCNDDPEYTATKVTEYIQRVCFGHRSPICIKLERVCSVWMCPNKGSTFALPLHDADACRPESWLNKGPLLNPAKQQIDRLHLTRALFATIACKHLHTFPETAKVAEEMAIRAIERLRLRRSEFGALMQLTSRVCPPDMYDAVSRLYEPYCDSNCAD